MRAGIVVCTKAHAGSRSAADEGCSDEDMRTKAQR